MALSVSGNLTFVLYPGNDDYWNHEMENCLDYE